MKATADDYYQALDTFVAGMSELGENLKGILLYGSVVGDRFVPGRSDLLDAYVFFPQNVLEDFSEYRRAIGKLVDQCVTMSKTGLPYKHPPHYYGDEETRYLPREFLPEMLDDTHTRVLWGENLRESFPRENGGILSATIEEVRQFTYLHLSKFLSNDSPSPEEKEILVTHLHAWVCKFLPAWACASAGVSTPVPVAVDRLKSLFPEINFSVVDRVADMKNRIGDLPGTDELKTLLRDGLVFCEEVYEHVIKAIEPAARR